MGIPVERLGSRAKSLLIAAYRPFGCTVYFYIAVSSALEMATGGALISLLHAGDVKHTEKVVATPCLAAMVKNKSLAKVR
jgi:hypothetical protein